MKILSKKAETIDIRNLKLDRKLEDLGIMIDNKRAYNFSLIVAIVWIVNVLMFYLSSFLWGLGHITVIQLVAMIVTQHSMHVNSLINLTFGLLMRNMALRFRNINQALEKFKIKTNNLSVTNDLLYDNRRVMNNRANLFKDTSNYLNHLLQIFK